MESVVRDWREPRVCNHVWTQSALALEVRAVSQNRHFAIPCRGYAQKVAETSSTISDRLAVAARSIAEAWRMKASSGWLIVSPPVSTPWTSLLGTHAVATTNFHRSSSPSTNPPLLSPLYICEWRPHRDCVRLRREFGHNVAGRV